MNARRLNAVEDARVEVLVKHQTSVRAYSDGLDTIVRYRRVSSCITVQV